MIVQSTYRLQLCDVPAEILRDIHHLIYNAVHLLDTRDNDISNDDKESNCTDIACPCDISNDPISHVDTSCVI